MTDFENQENHISEWVKIEVLQNLSYAYGIENGVNEYSTVGEDSIPTISPDVFVANDNLQSISSSGIVTPTPHPDKLGFQMMLIIGMLVTFSVCIIGSIGNLLTIATFVYQFKLPACKRYVSRCSADTILILNLCIADLFYSAVSLPFMFVIYLKLYFHVDEALGDGYEVFGYRTCKWAALCRYTNAITEWTTLGIMALERCVTIYRFQRKLRPKRLFSPIKTLSYMIFLWIFAMAAQMLTFTERYGKFGYNQDTLKCDFMPTGNATYFVTPRVFFFALESAVPCFFILIGYFVILMQVYSSQSFFTGNNSLTSATVMSMCLRRSKTTRLIMLLLTIYLVCVIPICIYNVFIHENELGEPINQIVGIALYCLYWLQYAVNNFIYVVSNEKFRNGYSQFFSMILCRDIPSPSRSKYLRIQTDKACRIQTIMATREHPRMRIRTPSEMTIEGFSRRESMLRSQTQIGILAISLNITAPLNEFPILVFPEAHLTNYCSDNKANVICYERDKFLSLDPDSYFKTFKLYTRRSSLSNLEKRAANIRRRRSVSV